MPQPARIKFTQTSSTEVQQMQEFKALKEKSDEKTQAYRSHIKETCQSTLNLEIYVEKQKFLVSIIK